MKSKTIFLLILTSFLVGLLPPENLASRPRRMMQTDEEKAALEILEKHIDALGGRERLGVIKTVTIETESEVLGRTIRQQRTEDLVGNRSYSRQDGSSGVSELGFDGRRAWQRAAFFRGYLDAESQQAKALSRRRLPIPGSDLLDYQLGGKKFLRLANETVENKEYIVIKSVTADKPDNKVVARYYFDPETNLLRKTVTGDAITQTETFSDYRQIDGVTIAFASQIVNPQYSINNKTISVRFNEPVSDALFEFEKVPTKLPPTAAEPTTKNGSDQITAANGNNVATQPSGELSESVRRETFEEVWKTVNDTFYDPDFNGVNWKSVYDRYLPSISKTPNVDDFHRLMNTMVGELGLSHFRVFPPGEVVTLSSTSTGTAKRNGSPGLSLVWTENMLIVRDVRPNSPAAAAGVMPGQIVRRINGQTADQLYGAYRKENPGFRLREELSRVRAANRELSGSVEQQVTIELLDSRDKPVSLELSRQPDGSTARELAFEAKRLEKEIGYIRFNLFFGDLLTKFKGALEELRDTEGLIIDLRDNPGGAGDLAPAMASLISREDGSLGSLKFRYDLTHYSFRGVGDRAYQGKVIILTNEGTGSTSEVFAAGLQTNRRAIVIGSNSAGAVLPSIAKLLKTGGALQHVVSNFQTTNGVQLEGRGVTPDVAVKPSRADFVAGKDPVLARAVKFVRDSK